MTIYNNNNFNIACNESIEIIRHMEEKLKERIPSKMIDFLEKNKVEGYNVNIDFSKNILEQNILFETKGIISVIYRDYIATPQKRNELLKWDKQEELREEIEKREKYNPDSIFKNNKKENTMNNNNEILNCTQIVEYKEPIFKRIIKKILEILHIK